jgi:hypothetical protein
MKGNLVFAAWLASSALVMGDGEHLATLKAGTEVYTNITVTSVSATHLYFTHSRGLGDAKLKDVDPSVQKMFITIPRWQP